MSWDNYACLSPAQAKNLGLSEGDVVRLKDIEIPVHIQPGQAAGAISVAVGYGRTQVGRAGNGVGVNVSRLRSVREGLVMNSGSVSLEKTGKRVDLACTQLHHSMEGRDIVREVSLVDLAKASHEDQIGRASCRERVYVLV